MAMILCPHPQRCGVQKHIAGSQSARECTSVPGQKAGAAPAPVVSDHLNSRRPPAGSTEMVESFGNVRQWSGQMPKPLAKMLYEEQGFRPRGDVDPEKAVESLAIAIRQSDAVERSNRRDREPGRRSKAHLAGELVARGWKADAADGSNMATDMHSRLSAADTAWDGDDPGRSAEVLIQEYGIWGPSGTGNAHDDHESALSEIIAEVTDDGEKDVQDEEVRRALADRLESEGWTWET